MELSRHLQFPGVPEQQKHVGAMFHIEQVPQASDRDNFLTDNPRAAVHWSMPTLHWFFQVLIIAGVIGIGVMLIITLIRVEKISDAVGASSAAMTSTADVLQTSSTPLIISPPVGACARMISNSLILHDALLSGNIAVVLSLTVPNFTFVENAAVGYPIGGSWSGFDPTKPRNLFVLGSIEANMLVSAHAGHPSTTWNCQTNEVIVQYPTTTIYRCINNPTTISNVINSSCVDRYSWSADGKTARLLDAYLDNTGSALFFVNNCSMPVTRAPGLPIIDTTQTLLESANKIAPPVGSCSTMLHNTAILHTAILSGDINQITNVAIPLLDTNFTLIKNTYYGFPAGGIWQSLNLSQPRNVFEFANIFFSTISGQTVGARIETWDCAQNIVVVRYVVDTTYTCPDQSISSPVTRVACMDRIIWNASGTKALLMDSYTDGSEGALFFVNQCGLPVGPAPQ